MSRFFVCCIFFWAKFCSSCYKLCVDDPLAVIYRVNTVLGFIQHWSRYEQFFGVRLPNDRARSNDDYASESRADLRTGKKHFAESENTIIFYVCSPKFFISTVSGPKRKKKCIFKIGGKDMVFFALGKTPEERGIIVAFPLFP